MLISYYFYLPDNGTQIYHRIFFNCFYHNFLSMQFTSVLSIYVISGFCYIVNFKDFYLVFLILKLRYGLWNLKQNLTYVIPKKILMYIRYTNQFVKNRSFCIKFILYKETLSYYQDAWRYMKIVLEFLLRSRLLIYTCSYDNWFCNECYRNVIFEHKYKNLYLLYADFMSNWLPIWFYNITIYRVTCILDIN